MLTEAIPTELSFERFVAREEQGQYLLLPFEMPANTQRLTLSYHYSRERTEQPKAAGAEFTTRERINIIDLGLIGPDGQQVGASGSSKSEISISAQSATEGYRPTPLTPGTWQIILGAYFVAPEGVTVSYTLRFEPKQPHWLQGDLHTHTSASDGIHSLQHLTEHAAAIGLDFLGITDHNQPISRASLPQLPGLTLIPGLEWTHYQGHSNFLGHEAPFEGAFIANSEAEAGKIFQQAHQNGALIVINHPFEERYGFRFNFENLPYDLFEVWNGPMRPANLQSIAYWDAQLKAGRKIMAVCGSDYHADTVFEQLAGPCLHVYTQSTAEEDILEAVKAGRSFFTFQPNTLELEMHAEGVGLGGSLPWHQGLEMEIELRRLHPGDQIKLIDCSGEQVLAVAPGLEAAADPASPSFTSSYASSVPITRPGYARLEVWRSFFPGIPTLPALVSNPIFFD